VSAINRHGAEAFVSGIDDEAKTRKLLLHLPLELIITRGRRGAVIAGVIVEVPKGSKKGMLLGLGLLAVHLLERLLVEALPSNCAC
jgi:hypothetical protein